MSQDRDNNSVGFRDALRSAIFVIKETYYFSKKYFFAFGAITIIEAINPILFAWLGGQVITELTKITDADFEKSRLITLLVISAVANLAFFIANSLDSNYRMNLRERFDVHLLTKLLTQRASTDLLTYEQPETQKRFKYAEEGAREFTMYLSTVQGIASSIIGGVGVMLVILTTVPWVLAILLPLAAGSIVWNNRIFKSYRDNWDKIKNNWQRSNEVYGMFMSEAGVMEVRSLSLSSKLMSIWRSERQVVIDIEKEDNRQRLILDLIVRLVETLVAVAVDIWLAFRLFAGAITVGTFEQTRRLIGSFVLMLSRLGNGLSNINVANVKIHDYIVCIRSDADTEDHHLKSLKPMNFNKLELKNASFSYQKDDQLALNNVDFLAEKGQKIAIVGANGSGKSTLVKCLLGFYKLDKGEVLINDSPAKPQDHVRLLNNISPLHQDVRSYNFLKLGKSVAIAGKGYDKAKVMESIEFVGLGKKVADFKDGLNTDIGYVNDGVKLSGGEYQRLGIARALYKDGDLVVLDEPTSAIDSDSEQTIVNRLMKLKGKTVLMVSHRLSLVALVDTIIVMKDGKIVEQGTHKQLFKKGTEYYRLFEKQKKAIDI